MWLKTVIFSAFIVQVIECSDKIEFPKFVPPASHLHAKQLLSMCFTDNLNPVAVTVDLIDVVYEIPKNETINSSIVVIDENFSSEKIQKYYPRHPSFVLSGDSIDTLIPLLKKIKFTIIWNVNSVFLIIGTECQNVVIVLQMLWSFEVLQEFFICRDESENKTLILTHNPFTNYAPEPWQEVGIFDETEGKWTLFLQDFVNDPEICKSITFDKSERLDRFPVSGAIFGSSNEKVVNEVSKDLFSYYPPGYYSLYKNLHSVLNSKPVIHITQDTDYDNYGKFLKQGKFDLDMVPGAFQYIPVKYYDILAYYRQDGYIILTQKQTTVPIINQIVDSYFNSCTAITSCMILLLILMIIYVHNNRILSEALMDMLGLLFDMGIMVPLNRLPMRITFFAATLFMLIFNPALQGHVSAILTKPGRQQVESLEDLYNNKFHVYLDKVSEEIIFEMGLWKKNSDAQYIHSDYQRSFDNCIEIISKNPLTACFLNSAFLPDKIDESIHLSQNFYFEDYTAVRIRSDWALKNKFNKVAMNYVETGHADFIDRNSLFKRLLRKKRLIARIEAAEQYGQIDFDFFEFDWLIIPLSLFWTVLVLGIELLIWRFKRWNKRRLKKLKIKKSRARRRIASITRRIRTFARRVHEV